MPLPCRRQRPFPRLLDHSLIVARFLLCLAVSLACWAADPAAEPSLADDIEKVLSQASAQRAFWGIEIVELETGRVLYERNVDKLFTPASNQKLFSTALALSRLGPEYRHATSVLTSSAVDEAGALRGDIVLLGGGDPNLSSRVVPYNPKRNFHPDLFLPIRELASQVAGAGVRRIEGSVIGDDTRYVRQQHGVGWSVDDPTWGYGAPISALSFNDNILTVRILPGRQAGRPARLTLEPGIPYFKFENKTRTAATRTVARALKADREPGTRTVLLWGEISIRSRGRSITVAADDPALYAALALKEELERQGVEVTGEPRSRHLWPHEVPSPQTRTAARALARHDDPSRDPVGIVGRLFACGQQDQPEPARGDAATGSGLRRSGRGHLRSRSGGVEGVPYGSGPQALGVQVQGCIGAVATKPRHALGDRQAIDSHVEVTPR